jgi:hypothetical protein
MMFTNYTLDQIGIMQVIHSGLLGALLMLNWLILRQIGRDRLERRKQEWTDRTG